LAALQNQLRIIGGSLTVRLFFCIVVRQNLLRCWLLLARAIRNLTIPAISIQMFGLQRNSQKPYMTPFFRYAHPCVVFSYRPPYMRKAENSGFSNGSGRNLQNN
jgi:hypothetical protein